MIEVSCSKQSDASCRKCIGLCKTKVSKLSSMSAAQRLIKARIRPSEAKNICDPDSTAHLASKKGETSADDGSKETRSLAQIELELLDYSTPLIKELSKTTSSSDWEASTNAASILLFIAQSVARGPAILAHQGNQPLEVYVTCFASILAFQTARHVKSLKT